MVFLGEGGGGASWVVLYEIHLFGGCDHDVTIPRYLPLYF